MKKSFADILSEKVWLRLLILFVINFIVWSILSKYLLSNEQSWPHITVKALFFTVFMYFFSKWEEQSGYKHYYQLDQEKELIMYFQRMGYTIRDVDVHIRMTRSDDLVIVQKKEHYIEVRSRNKILLNDIPKHIISVQYKAHLS